MLHALTFDIEEYFQVSGFEQAIPLEHWPIYQSRVEMPTRRILDILAEHGTSATFFILGWVAREHPQLVRDIAAAGHEIGSHSDLHRLVYRLSPDEFRDDLRRSKHALEDITGSAVASYRAPSFSITRRSLWALDILIEEGIRYDASIFPVLHDRYGIPNARKSIHRIRGASGELWEVPATVAGGRRFRLPVGGGGYLRLYPWRLTRRLLRSVERGGRPFVVYIHPWELDPDQPHLGIGSRLAQFRHYVNLKTTETKLHRLLDTFPLGRLDRTVQSWYESHPDDTATQLESA